MRPTVVVLSISATCLLLSLGGVLGEIFGRKVERKSADQAILDVRQDEKEDCREKTIRAIDKEDEMCEAACIKAMHNVLDRVIQKNGK